MTMIHSVQKETKDIRELSCYSFARNQRNRQKCERQTNLLLFESENRKQTRIRTVHRLESFTKNTTNEGIWVLRQSRNHKRPYLFKKIVSASCTSRRDCHLSLFLWILDFVARQDIWLIFEEKCEQSNWSNHFSNLSQMHSERSKIIQQRTNTLNLHETAFNFLLGLSGTSWEHRIDHWGAL